MSSDPLPGADPADVAEQDHDVIPPEEGSPDVDDDELSAEANEADVVEQHTDVPGWDDEETAEG